MRSALTLVLVSLLMLATAARPAGAADPTTPAPPAAVAVPAVGLTATESQHLLDILQDPKKRADLIATLQGLQKVTPVATPATGTAAPAAAAKAAPPKAVGLKKDSLASDLLVQTGFIVDHIDSNLSSTAVAMTNYQDFVVWGDSVSETPGLLRTVLSTIWRLAIVLILALLAEYLTWRFTSRLYGHLGQARVPGETDAPPVAATLEETATPAATSYRALKPLHDGWLLLKRLPFILLALVVDVIPPLIFLGVATLVLATPLTVGPNMRLTILAVVNAYVLCRLILCVMRAVICSPSPRLRLLGVSNDTASFLAVWFRRLALVIVFSYASTQIGALSGMSLAMQLTLTRVFGLILHGMLITMVIMRRREVADWLRGKGKSGGGFWQDTKARAASVWHIQAIILIVLVWIVYATQVASGIGHPLHLILTTMGLLILFRVVSVIVLGALDRAFAFGALKDNTRYALIGARAARYHGPLRALVNTVLVVIFVMVLFQSWGIDATAWFQVGGLGGKLISSLATIGVTLVIAIIVWETINFVMQVYMDDLSQQGAYVRVARLRTVVPLLRNALLIALLVIIALTALSEIGVNIGPLLAGASILGVAIGFGSQKLVQDFITGIFLLLENAMQVGDSVTAAGLSGTVENLSIRTLRLRAGDGSIHLIPFSAVSTVTNSNRGLGNAAVSVTVSYEEDTDRVGAILSQIALDMRQEDAFKNGMLSDLQLWGVDRVDGSTATLVGQIVCTDGGRWGVQREFNRRIKLAFQKDGIRLMPSATIIGFQHPLDVRVETSPTTGSAVDPAPPSGHN